MELSSHWISSFFLGDKFLNLPATPSKAIEEAQMHGAWMKKRHPDTSLWPSESCGSNFVTHSYVLYNTLAVYDADCFRLGGHNSVMIY